LLASTGEVREKSGNFMWSGKWSPCDKRLAGTSAVQTFIHQFVVLNKINRLTSKRFEQKYLLLSGFMLEVVQINPANVLYSIHV